MPSLDITALLSPDERRELKDLFSKGSDEAFVELIKYADVINAQLYRYAGFLRSTGEVEDLFQTFVVCLMNRQRRAPLRTEGCTFAYVMKAAAFFALKARKKAARERERFSFEDLEQIEIPTEEELPVCDEMLQVVVEEIRKEAFELPSNHRKAFLERYGQLIDGTAVDPTPIRDVAEKLKVSVATVNRWLRAAKKRIAQSLITGGKISLP